MKTCYYELLGVETNATDVELKKAYRRKALQFHPDKNPDNVEETTAIFASVRAAYEVLADPQERAWYDDHKEQILNDSVNLDDADDESHLDSSITGVTSDELLMFFNSSLYTNFGNSPSGVYQIIGKIFAKLAMDEVYWARRLRLDGCDKFKDDVFEHIINTNGYMAAVTNRLAETYYMFPAFGHSQTDYEYLKEFYKKWSSFSTLKSFTWKDEYMYMSTYDRRTKREVNKRNEKSRNAARGEYNKTVKRFVSFVKKLDKRMKAGAQRQENERKMQKEAAKNGNDKKQRASGHTPSNTQTDFEWQSWQMADEPNWDELEKEFQESSLGKEEDEHLKSTVLPNSTNEDEILVYECVICDKIFKSVKQLDNHQNTKLHRKNLALLKREMQKDNMTLGLDALSDLDDYDSADETPSKEQTTNGDIPKDNCISLDDLNEQLAEIERQLAEQASSSEDEDDQEHNSLPDVMDGITEMVDPVDNVTGSETTGAKTTKYSTEGDSDVSSASVSDIENREPDELARLLASLESLGLTEDGFTLDSDSDDDWRTGSKAKRKNAKNTKKQNNGGKNGKKTKEKAGSEPANTATQQSCSVCNASFVSRNELFAHITALGHAAPPGKASKKKNKRKNKT
ncbi:Jjj1p KNAG_0F00860 [Huiozyma naganishii CBS 8797]|uniref:J domain-containing protein n=1 Tax=Huiozyma naganishii (strain ATCC MYA-139 / BCRC 22969 / CBS 8797 / KCTC 17520 / NBRC 10181 / NCYC 3082 / Yp74L-3) TaxID=1071383 RepID=J7R7B4_HUIN7|nr:hypothetical protein KNAG_0F00860 [Kazachstania naganishii CBS 8797]CCK70755.1 hypothetical protein KNAG_0F00860 [Kazachstania naganishii CBS 8797]